MNSQNWAPTAAAGILFIALIGSTYSYRSRLDEIEAADRDFAAQDALTMARDSTLFTVGDTLPHVALRARNGRTIRLDRLVGRYRYIYFGRATCPACALLRTVLDTTVASRRDSIAYIAYSPDSIVAAGESADDYQWIQTPDTRNRYVNHVPTVLVVRSDGRISAVAHGSVLRAAALFDLFHVVRKPALEQAFLDASAVAWTPATDSAR